MQETRSGGEPLAITISTNNEGENDCPAHAKSLGRELVDVEPYSTDHSTSVSREVGDHEQQDVRTSRKYFDAEGSSTLSLTTAPEVQEPAPLEYPECERVILPPIERWEDLPCIRLLNRMYDKGTVNGRGYQILYRMCQMIWAIGHEVIIRKKVKLPRAQRLNRFRQLCDAVYQGAKLWQRNMKTQMYSACRVIVTLPRLDTERPFQDLEPTLNVWCDALKKIYCPSLEDFKLFSLILEHYHDNYRVLYGLHGEKPDYGLRDVFPTADKVFKVLIKLPGYALMADELMMEVDLNFWINVDCYYKDRARQREEVAEFDAMAPEQKMEDFKAYMRFRQQGFVREVNSPTAVPMSQEAFNAHLQLFRWDYLNKIAHKIKHDTYRIDALEEDWEEFDQILQLMQQQHDARQAKKGWVQALGINAEDAAALYVDDEPEGSDEEFDVDLDEFDIILFRGPALPKDSALSRLLDGGKQQQWQLQGVVDWTRPHKVKTKPCAALQETEREFAEQSARLARARLPKVAVSVSASDIQNEQPLLQTVIPDTSKERSNQPGAEPPFPISKSFAPIKDDLGIRGHQRSSTVPDANYVTGDAHSSNLPRPAASFHGRATSTRRHGVQVPRIFTGSFSQLETDIRKMKLDKVKTPEEQPDLLQDRDLQVRDFAVTPRRSPSLTPSPATLLFRREALLSKETELQDRFINGEIVRTRRPSTKTRAQTLRETTIEAWLAKDEARSDSPTLATPALHRPDRKTAL